MISIIIPTYNEAKTIVKCLASIYLQNENYEIIVVDGGSSDNTVDLLTNKKKVSVVFSKKSRSCQMNLGAKHASGEVLLFLHADAVLHSEAFSEIEKAISNGFIGGGFYQQFKEKKEYRLLSIVSFRSNLRARMFKVFFGDQGIFVQKDIFVKLSGFKEIPIMEDLEFCKGMKEEGTTSVIKKKITVSGRNYIEKGVLRLTFVYFILMCMYHLRFSFERIKKMHDKLL